MNDIKSGYLLLYLLSVFLAAVSQILLKKAALIKHDNIIAEYIDVRVLAGYGIFLLCTFMTMYAYKGIPMNIGPILECTGYIYVMIFGAIFFKERITRGKIIALMVIVLGVIIYTI